MEQEEAEQSAATVHRAEQDGESLAAMVVQEGLALAVAEEAQPLSPLTDY